MLLGQCQFTFRLRDNSQQLAPAIQIGSASNTVGWPPHDYRLRID
jgi:hypothetical protein